MEHQKVFCSEIIRGQKPLNNNLNDLINIIPAKPIKRTLNDSTWHFEPQLGKIYIPKKRNKIKVKTVSDIRNLYEKDIFSELPRYLETQKKILLRKIREGSSRNENTKTLAKNILSNNKPVSRSAWQMIMHLNPEDHKYSTQYILWNGKKIQINGSKGGNDELIYCYDLGKKRPVLPKKKIYLVKKRQEMLKNSLSIQFKPGPLTKKKYLDNSHQKYSIGDIELIELPIPSVHIEPTFDVALEPTITNFLHKYRDVDGTISKSWAEFAVSTLGTVKDSRAIQVDKGSVIFRLTYKYNQRRILMRREVSNSLVHPNPYPYTEITYPHSLNENHILPEVITVVDDILSSVEISLMQDNMYSGEEEPRDVYLSDSNVSFNHCTSKLKRKYAELERLHVTVINLDEELQTDPEECKKQHCSLGCVCASLNRTNHFKEHCGRIQCMFYCICDHSKYNVDDLFKEQKCPELLSGLIKLDNDKNFNLAKEEKKFHQTVILTGEKSILLKSQKRSSKISKKYAEFYNLAFEKENKENKEISINVLKLNCSNIEPWCMIHELYKCFCKGRFIEKSYSEYNKEVTKAVSLNPHEKINDVHLVEHKETINKTFNDNECNNLVKKHLNSESSEYNDFLHETDDHTYVCARSKPFSGRKYSNNYYFHTNKKILKMEKNDINLHTKLLKCMNPEVGNQKNEITTGKNKDTASDQRVNVDTLESIPAHVIEKSSSPNIQRDSMNKLQPQSSQKIVAPESVSNQSSFSFPKRKYLISLLETSYQEYKKRCEQNCNLSLLPPKLGKLALYPWEFITNRYREKKNLFLFSPQSKPRIFMAVDVKHPFLKNCINIDNICLSDVDNYPMTVRNLLTNAKDLKGHFCILRGLSFCWELVGSVSKTNNEAETETKLEDVSSTDVNKSPAVSVVDRNDTTPGSSDNIDANISLTALVTNESNLAFESVTSIATESPIMDSFPNSREDFSGLPDDIVVKKSVVVPVTNNGQESSDTINKSLVVPVTNNSKELFDTIGINKTPMGNNDEDLSSKWFLMIVEDDFTEVQFFSKGFFVKYDSIIQAIHVARKSGKTVRLSSQKCIDNAYEPQFGVYAVPNSKMCTVFIGPYEKDESLGLETVKKISDLRKQKKTRGVWFIINKCDNIKVIENPFLYMQVTNQEMTPLDNFYQSKTSDENTENNVKTRQENPIENKSTSSTNPTKSVKPIKIRKTNGFYHFLPGTLLNRTTKTPLFLESTSSGTPLSKYSGHKGFTCMKFPVPYTSNSVLKRIKNDTRLDNATVPTALKKSEDKIALIKKKPVAEIAPQVKLNTESSKIASPKPRKPELGILKPEEINQRLNFNALILPSVESNVTPKSDMQIEMDIENFLVNSTECEAPNDDIFVISDEEEDRHGSIKKQWQDVWLQCKNIQNLGAIKGRVNNNKCLSFEFPGFKFTDFYTEKKAFVKINQVLSRKVYIPKHIYLEWEVIECERDLKSNRLLKTEDLDPDLVMTKDGLQHKQYLATNEKVAILNSEVTTLENKLQKPKSPNNVGIESLTTTQRKQGTKIDPVVTSKLGTNDPSTSGKGKRFVLTNEDHFIENQAKSSASDDLAVTSGEGVMYICDKTTEISGSEQDTGVPCTIVATYSLGKGQEIGDISQLNDGLASSKETTSRLDNAIITNQVNPENSSALFQEHSGLLEEIGSALWSETISKKDDIMYSLNSVSSQQRQQMAEKLEFIRLENKPEPNLK